MHCQLTLELRHLRKPDSHTAVVPSPTSPEPAACGGGRAEPAAPHALGQPGRVPPAVHLPARPGHGAEAASSPGASGHPGPTGTCLEQLPCRRRARQPPTVASRLPAPSCLPVAPGWGWGCGGVSQSGMPIWNPSGTFNPPHPFQCCLSSPPPTHTNAAIQAVNLNKFCPATTSRSDEKAKRSSSKPRGE